MTVEIMSNRTGRFRSKSKGSYLFCFYVSDSSTFLTSSIFKINRNSAFTNPKFYQCHILLGNENMTHRAQFNLTYLVDYLLPVIDLNSKHYCQFPNCTNLVV